jgi:hypothetical protein
VNTSYTLEVKETQIRLLARKLLLFSAARDNGKVADT